MFNKQVECIDCGYLGVWGGSDKMAEIQPSDRADLSGYFHNLFVTCLRGQEHIIAGQPPTEKPIDQEALMNNAYLPRKCRYFFQYNPGYIPEQHLELQQERTRRRFLVMVSLLSAAIGAGIATAANFIYSVFNR